MAAIVWSDVVAMYPGAAGVAAGAQTDILAYVNAFLNVAVFGGEAAIGTRMARILLAAHFAAVGFTAATGAAGPVTSESAGGLSRSYGFLGGSATAGESLGSTSWGQQYLAMLRSNANIRGPMVI